MSKVTLMHIDGHPVYWDEAESRIWYTGEFTIDADGAPNAYSPEGSGLPALDYIDNAGYPGNWWALSCNDDGVPYIQQHGDKHKWPYPGYYISTTCYEWHKYAANDVRRFVDSSKIAYCVVPGSVRTAVAPKFMGCACRVTDKKSKKVIAGIPCCDVGPAHLGEGSIWLAEQFGLDSNPKSGGSSDRSRFLWEFWPGIESESHPLQ